MEDFSGRNVFSRVYYDAMLKTLHGTSSELVLENPYWQYRRDRYIRPDGAEGIYEYIRTPGSAMIVPLTSEGKLVLVRQYRYLNSRESLEFAGGGIKNGQTAVEAARAELAEETGYACERIEEIGSFNPMNGVTDELCTVFFATGLSKTIAAADASEEFEIEELTLDEVHSRIVSGELWDGMTLAALSLYEHRKRL